MIVKGFFKKGITHKNQKNKNKTKKKTKKQERTQHRWSFESWKPNGEVGNLLSRSDKAEPYNNSEKKTIFTAPPQKDSGIDSSFESGNEDKAKNRGIG